jgi:hypothetical protein
MLWLAQKLRSRSIFLLEEKIKKFLNNLALNA